MLLLIIAAYGGLHCRCLRSAAFSPTFLFESPACSGHQTLQWILQGIAHHAALLEVTMALLPF